MLALPEDLCCMAPIVNVTYVRRRTRNTPRMESWMDDLDTGSVARDVVFRARVDLLDVVFLDDALASIGRKVLTQSYCRVPTLDLHNKKVRAWELDKSLNPMLAV